MPLSELLKQKKINIRNTIVKHLSILTHCPDRQAFPGIVMTFREVPQRNGQYFGLTMCNGLCTPNQSDRVSTETAASNRHVVFRICTFSDFNNNFCKNECTLFTEKVLEDTKLVYRFET